MLTLELSEPVGTVLESHEWTTLTITDSDDQASVRLAYDIGIQFRESVGRAAIKVRVCETCVIKFLSPLKLRLN